MSKYLPTVDFRQLIDNEIIDFGVNIKIVKKSKLCTKWSGGL